MSDSDPVPLRGPNDTGEFTPLPEDDEPPVTPPQPVLAQWTCRHCGQWNLGSPRCGRCLRKRDPIQEMDESGEDEMENP